MSLEFIHDARSTKDDVRLHGPNGRKSIIVVRNRVPAENASAPFFFDPHGPITQRAYRVAQKSNSMTTQRSLCSGQGSVPYDYSEDSSVTTTGDEAGSGDYDGVIVEMSDYQHFHAGNVTMRLDVSDSGMRCDFDYESPLLVHSDTKGEDTELEHRGQTAFDLTTVTYDTITVSNVPENTEISVISPRNATYWQYGSNNVVVIRLPEK